MNYNNKTAKTIISQNFSIDQFQTVKAYFFKSLFPLLFWCYSKTGAHMGLSEKHLVVVIMKSFRALIYSQFTPK